ncbi:MAG: cytochrome ubiquinol oxidase subunit I, partial [Muribaculaceae bacterium]|nr:cytochrome ubiquinol oxidase subunit I [Muribaculaceae bacterium]
SDLRAYDNAMAKGDKSAMATAKAELAKNFQFFGYGYFDDVKEAIPPVGVTFWTFRIMCFLGGYFLLFFVVVLFLVYRTRLMERAAWMQWIAMLSVPLMWVCSEAGWAVAEVGRQPWTVQDLLPTKAAISEIPASSVIVTFWLFAVVFTVLLVAEVSIMCRQISKESKKNLSPSIKS